MNQLARILLAVLFGAHLSLAQRTPDRPPSLDNSVEAELASFEVHPEFEVSLFADETLGIANPSSSSSVTHLAEALCTVPALRLQMKT